ncbi:unnamed protein product [Clonostachys chloroleuca]|uniref:COX assembly mitochondrial protein n=1 Tax=Clonostachys chloroleuca TaxID=1926264 RepID=A0AA35Q3K3_9HYPO|nr:unnamed protein product [Clonostachys chloroleuca]
MASNDAPQRLGVPSRNPLPLSASQESQVRDIYYARVRKLCSDEIKAFADCALGRTFTVSFQCREQHREMNSCLTRFATPAEHDAAREEWFAMRLERQRERERKARMAAAQEEFLREWWALPEEVRLSRPKPEGIESRPERVGGMPAAQASSSSSSSSGR